MYSVSQVAGTIAERSGWTFSNLALQKLTFLAQMLHLGKTETPFFPEDFEAWDYGPVVPSLYRDLRMFGAGAVAPFSALDPIAKLTEDESAMIEEIVELGLARRPGQLVAITHWKNGAWAKCYSKHIKNLLIPKSLIKAEYDERVKLAA